MDVLPQMTGQREFISHVGASIAETRRIDGENQGLEASTFGASYQI